MMQTGEITASPTLAAPSRRDAQRWGTMPLWVVLAVVGLSTMWIVLGSQILAGARSHDFLNIYTGASLAREGHFADLHDPSVQLARERQIFPQLPSLVPFVRPSFYAALLEPLSLLSYDTAFAVWIALQSVVLLSCWTWIWWRFGPDALVFAALYLPSALGIASGQDCAMMLGLFIICFHLAERGRWFASGAALALMLVKFHLILLWPLALLVQRRWRMLAGFSASAAILSAICAALGGLGSLRMYVALLENKSLDRLSPSPELMISVQGMLTNLGVESRGVTAALAGAVALIWLWCVRNAPLWSTCALTAAASLWIVPHVYGYDASLLLLPILLTIYGPASRASKIAATFLSTPVPFGFALAGKPWAIVSSLSLAVFLLLLAVEQGRIRPSAGRA